MKSAIPPTLAAYFAQMEVDRRNAVALLDGPPGNWLNREVLRLALRDLGPFPPKLCLAPVIVRETRRLARIHGLPWPTLEETIELCLNENPESLSR